MLGEELVDEAVRLLSTAIGMIMEDHAEQALVVARGPAEAAAAERLASAGHDISTLACAAAALLRRR